jgi:hypothetical protein
MNHAQFWGGAAGAYEIEQSLRFNSADSTNLSRTPSSTGNRKTFTVSCWVKRAQIGATQMIWSAGPASGGNIYLYFTSSDELQLSVDTEASGIVKTTQKFRDPSAWYHIVCAVDTSQATAANRVKFFINGTAVSSFASASYPSQNHDTHWNHTSAHRIGQRNDGTAFYINAYIAEFYNLDGTAVSDAEDFAEADDNGVWRPIAYTGSYGTNGFFLTFDPSATNGIGHDHSGNGNNFTPSGFTTSGTGTDVMSDTPTTNYCTWNSLVLPNGYSSTQDGNLVGRFTDSGNGTNMPATFAVSSGKWYWETTLTATGSGASTGITLDTFNYSAAAGANYIGGYSNGWAYQGSDGNKRNSPTNAAYGSTYTTGDIIGVALDMGTGKIWWSKNGTWQASGDPAAGTNEAFSNVTGTVVPAISGSGSGGTTTWTLNAGQRDFAYTPPTGYKALNTANLPAPTIKDGSKYFDAKLYTGSDATLTVNYDFGPDFVWIKSRSHGSDHSLYDIVRGTNLQLRSNSTNAEINDTNGFNSFNTNGFTLGIDTGDNINAASRTYAAWAWDAGGTGSSNTDGTITSTVSANPSAGFSIATYTGTGSNASVGHGLGVTPSMCIIKQRNTAQSWWVWHQALGNNVGANNTMLELNGTAGTYAADDVFRGFTPTVFQIGTDSGSNTNGGTYVAYCFSEVEGYSKFGSYTGNGSTDGPFVALNFRPAWVLIRQTNAISDWYLLDSTRASYNPAEPQLLANTAAAETPYTGWGDLLSNGFKVRRTDSAWNGSGSTYIFAAFAEHPTGGSGVSPATAR